MSRTPSPWSTEVEILDPERLRVVVMLSGDPGPAREFQRFLDVDLDEAHATELLGKLALALQDMRTQRDTDATIVARR